MIRVLRNEVGRTPDEAEIRPTYGETYGVPKMPRTTIRSSTSVARSFIEGNAPKESNERRGLSRGPNESRPLLKIVAPETEPTAKPTASRLRLRERMRQSVREAGAEAREYGGGKPVVDDRALNIAGWEESHDGPHGSVGWHHPRLGWIWSRQNPRVANRPGGNHPSPFLWYAQPHGELIPDERGPFRTIEAAIDSLVERDGAA